MNVADYIVVFRDRWRVLIGFILAGLILSSFAYVLTPFSYTASTTLYVSAQGSIGSASDAFQGAQLSEQRVRSYTQLATSDRVLADASRTLGGSRSIEDLRSNLSVDSESDSVLIDITAASNDAAGSANEANAVASAMVNLVGELERPASVQQPPPVVARIVQPALGASVPVSPRLSLYTLLGLVVGVVFGAAAAVVRARMDNKVKRADTISSRIGISHLGTIFHEELPGSKVIEFSQATPPAEAYRQLRTALQFVDVDAPPQVLVVTSALASEGKSTVASNFASVSTFGGLNVLLVDADLRRPRVANIYDLPDGVGLTSVLTGRLSLDDAIQRRRGQPDVLTAGALPPNPSEILGSQGMVNLIQHLRVRYDLIVFDSPPLLPVTDSSVLGSQVDGMLLVTRFGQTTLSEVQEAVARVGTVGGRLLGFVLNDAPPSRESGYYGYSPANRNDSEKHNLAPTRIHKDLPGGPSPARRSGS